MTNSHYHEMLRPVERRVLKMQDQGVSVDEIATRLRKSPAFVERLISWTQIPRTRPPTRSFPTAMQRVVLERRARGESHEDIGKSFKKSSRFIRQVEGLAHFHRGIELLSKSAQQARTRG